MSLDWTGSSCPLVPGYGRGWVSRGWLWETALGAATSPSVGKRCWEGGPCCLQRPPRRVSMPHIRPPSRTEPRSSHLAASPNPSTEPVCSNPSARPQHAPGGTAGKSCSTGSESHPKFGMRHSAIGSRGGEAVRQSR